MASGTEQTTSGYIQHHLQNLQVCKDDAGNWVWNQCSGNFWAINVDSMVFAVILGLVFTGIFSHVARNATPGKPGKLQAFIEILVDLVNTSVKETFHGKNALIAPLSLTIVGGAGDAGATPRDRRSPGPPTPAGPRAHGRRYRGSRQRV